MKLVKLIHSGNAWSGLDQTLVSGINFLIGIALARTLGLEGYGVYAVAQTYLLYANTFQASLVVAPMMTAVPASRSALEQRELLSGYFAYMILVLVATVCLVLAVGWSLGLWFEAIGLHGLALPLGAAMCCFQAQDWLRRALYARDQARYVFAGDVLAYGGQLLVLLVLARWEMLTPSSALWALAGTFGVSALITAGSLRLVPSARQMVLVVRTEWRASRDFWASWQLQWVASSGVVLVGTSLIGVQAAGAIRAVQNLTGPITVFFQWMDNVVPVRCVNRLRAGGTADLVAFLGRLNVAGVVVLSVIGVVLSVFAGPLLGWVYGEAFAPFALLVALQVAYYVAQHSYRMEAYLRRSLAQTELLARASFVWALVAVASAAATVPVFAEQGILAGMLLGQLAALGYLRWVRRSDTHLAGFSSPPSHVVLSHRAGRGRLVLPAANRHVLRSALDMYYPSRWTGRVYQRVLSTLLPPMLRLGIPVLARADGNWCPGMPQVAAALQAGRDCFYGGLVSYGWPRAKTTLKFMTADGRAIAYGRVAQHGAAVAALRNEAQVLAAVGRLGAAKQAPRVIGQGAISSGDGFFLLESAGSQVHAGNTLGRSEFEFLSQMVQDCPVAWLEALDTVETELAWAKEHQSIDVVVSSAIAALRRSGKTARLPRCIEHGDFVPWNIRRREDGSIFVIDWEHSRLDGLPWLDALHHCVQPQSLMRSLDSEQVVSNALRIFASSRAVAYAARVGPTDLPPVAFVAVYLMRAIAVGHCDGHAPESPQQAFRLLALERLLNDARLG